MNVLLFLFLFYIFMVRWWVNIKFINGAPYKFHWIVSTSSGFLDLQTRPANLLPGFWQTNTCSSWSCKWSTFAPITFVITTVSPYRCNFISSRSNSNMITIQRWKFSSLPAMYSRNWDMGWLWEPFWGRKI